ncbi:MAG: hypothetical protein IPO83_16065 [Chitinophagaceae bacterium]|nr:hypothetical protein [Chitinophagaceae bacterium]
MKSLIIASFTGALILFIYLALAHTILPVHASDFKYTAAQDNILNVLNAANLEEGFYFLPGSPPEASAEEKTNLMQEMAGKPGALINYYSKVDAGGAMTFIMSFIYNLLAVLILCVALAAASDKLINFQQRLWFVMLFAFFVIFSEIMLQYNWVGIPMHYIKGLIIDQIVGYLLVGIWLAWYYGRLSVKKVE